MRSMGSSIRFRLFCVLAAVIISIVSFLIILNDVVLEQFYLYNKKNTLLNVYETANDYYKNTNDIDIDAKLEEVIINNNFDVLIKTSDNIIIYASDTKDFLSTLGEIDTIEKSSILNKKSIIYSEENVQIKRLLDRRNGLNFILLSSKLDNGYLMYIRMPIASIKESVKISNEFLYLVGSIIIVVGGIAVLIISKRFTRPIAELNGIAKKMSKLDFTQKYKERNRDDEIEELGKSINEMSDKLEKTIKQLRSNNIELEKDIEEKSKIDEMRKQFISDVSHELKTPIALIQGYSEGLIENVNTDEESRRFYAEVILDETNKMDKLVKQLLELMNLEYGKRKFNDKKFDIVELINEVIRKATVMLEENNVKIEFEESNPVYVKADDFYIEQVLNNYFTNAIKNVEEVDGKKLIKIELEEIDNKLKIKVFNTGKNIEEENLSRIWNRFYKIDEARSREQGGSGIGLALVKAIMNNYQNNFGVENKTNGVEFYFEVNR